MLLTAIIYTSYMSLILFLSYIILSLGKAILKDLFYPKK